MSDDKVSVTPMQRRAAAVRARFEAEGITLAEWSRERGFHYSTVKQVFAGNRPCKRGESHRIAVALGIKDAQPPRPLPARREDGVIAA